MEYTQTTYMLLFINVARAIDGNYATRVIGNTTIEDTKTL